MPVQVEKTPYALRINLTELVAQKRPTAMALRAAALPPQAVDLHGWDTAFAIRMPDANRAIARAWAAAQKDPAHSQLPLTYKAAGEFMKSPAEADGSFGAWQLTQGGSSATVAMQVPLTSGTLTWSGQSLPYEKGRVIMTVQLGYVPRSVSDPKTGKPKDLKIVAPAQGSANPPVKPVTISQIVWDGTQPDDMVGVLLRPMLESWFATNMADFQYVFATININALADKNEWQWLKPTDTGFSYAQPNPNSSPKDDDCIFGLLCTVDGRSSQGLDSALDLGAIPPGARSGFVIGANAYYKNTFIPNLMHAFDNAQASDFAVVPSDNGTYSVANVNKVTMRIPKDDTNTNFENADLDPHNFTATLLANELQMKITHAHINVSPGIDLFMDYTYHVGCKLQARSDGTQALLLYDTQDIEQSHEVQKASWVTITEIAAGIIAGCLLYGAGASAGRAAVRALTAVTEVAEESIIARIVNFLVRAIIGGVVGGLLGNISSIIEANAESEAEKMPPFDPFAKEAVSATTWSDTTDVKITSVIFNGGLQLAVEPVFAE